MQDNIGIKVQKLIEPYLNKIHSDIDNKIVDDELWESLKEMINA